MRLFILFHQIKMNEHLKFMRIRITKGYTYNTIYEPKRAYVQHQIDFLHHLISQICSQINEGYIEVQHFKTQILNIQSQGNDPS